jgi:hypothetical protein
LKLLDDRESQVGAREESPLGTGEDQVAWLDSEPWAGFSPALAEAKNLPFYNRHFQLTTEQRADVYLGRGKAELLLLQMSGFGAYSA